MAKNVCSLIHEDQILAILYSMLGHVGIFPARAPLHLEHLGFFGIRAFTSTDRDASFRKKEDQPPSRSLLLDYLGLRVCLCRTPREDDGTHYKLVMKKEPNKPAHPAAGNVLEFGLPFPPWMA
jgi:hypothetical protein